MQTCRLSDSDCVVELPAAAASANKVSSLTLIAGLQTPSLCVCSIIFAVLASLCTVRHHTAANYQYVTEVLTFNCNSRSFAKRKRKLM